MTHDKSPPIYQDFFTYVCMTNAAVVERLCVHATSTNGHMIAQFKVVYNQFIIRVSNR